MITQKRLTTFLFLLFLLPLSLKASAHEFQPTKVGVLVHSSSQLELMVEVDLIELISQHLGMDGEAEELISETRNLPYEKVAEVLGLSLEHLNLEVEVIVDGERVEFQDFESYSPESIYELLQRDPNQVIYRSLFRSKAEFDSGEELQFRFPESLGAVSLTISNPSYTLLSANEISNGYMIEAGGIQGFSTKVATAVNYTHHGFLHVIPMGLDHIAFVMALCLLSLRPSTLIWQVSAFTLAHTLTLALSLKGLINLPSSIVEVFIALSIAWVAFENIITPKMHRWRLLIVFLFGLLHGLGFASALRELGLPASQWLTSLVFFNVGVELGHLSVVALTLLVIFWWRKMHWYRKVIQIPISAVIGCAGLFWTIERLI